MSTHTSSTPDPAEASGHGTPSSAPAPAITTHSCPDSESTAASGHPIPAAVLAVAHVSSAPETAGASANAEPVSQAAEGSGPAVTIPDIGEKRDPEGSGSGNRLVARAVANTSLLTALLIYMGWAYLNARLGYFQVSPLSLNLSIVDYALHSLAFFFDTNIIFLSAALVGLIVTGPRVAAAIALRAAFLAKFVPAAIRSIIRKVAPSNASLMARLGFMITFSTILLAWLGLRPNVLHSWFAMNPDVFYLVVILLGLGPLLMTRPSGSNSGGHFLYPLAIAVAAACILWVAGLYANNLGTTEAENIATHLSTQTAVTVYSVHSLGISGPGVNIQTLRGSVYHYRYGGLRLLIADSGTYYLLPVKWSPQHRKLYVIDDSDQVRIELS